MTLARLKLKQFRNFSAQDFEFHPLFNFIFGKNAQGKTNLIEAVSYLSELKSFRTTSKGDLIHKEAETAQLNGLVRRDNLDWDITITLSHQERKIEVNGKPPQKRQEYHSLLPLILFEPRHIYLFRDSPSERRRYLNRALFLMNPGFLTTINQYDKIVAQKNRILKDGFGLDQLDIWNEKLATLGHQIIEQRLQWFAQINTVLAREYQAISGGHDEYTLNYQPSLNSSVSQMLATLHEHRQEEITRREAFLGPHRDDFKAQLGERDLANFGSQGENRSAIIALKMAQLKLYSQKFGKTPLFLLDDVASELDATRRQHLFSTLRDEAAQVFVTTTENEIISDDYKQKSRVFLVEAGTVSVLV